MHITEYALKGLIPLTVLSNISQIDVSISSPVQVIIGTNGSGKTSILRELSALPSVRSDYKPGGTKHITLSVNDNIIDVISEFTHKSSIHKFIVNGESLNDSGTASVQEDLIKKHIGYTKDIHDIMAMNMKLSTLAPGNRKTWLMGINPHNVDFVLELHKKLQSRIRELKSFLSRMYERKGVLEEKIISDEIILNMESEKNKLNTEYMEIVEFIHRLKEYMSDVKEPSMPSTNFAKIENVITEKLSQWSNINKSNPQLDVELLNKEMAILTSKIAMRHDDTIIVRKEIDDIDNTLIGLQLGEANTALASEIDAYQSLISTLSIDHTLDIIPEYRLNDCRDVISKLDELTPLLIGVPGTLLSSIEIVELTNTLQKLSIDVEKVQLQIDATHKVIEKLCSSKSIIIDDIPQPCAGDKCVLYVRCKSDNLEVDKNIKMHTDNINIYESSLKELNLRITQYTEMYNSTVGYVNIVDEILELRNNNRRLLDIQDLVKAIQTNGSSGYKKAIDLVNNSDKYYQHRTLTTKLNDLILQHARQTSVSQDQIVTITENRRRLLKRMTVLTNELSVYQRSLNMANKKKKDIEEFISISTWLNKERETWNTYVTDGRSFYGQMYIRKLYDNLVNRRNAIVSELGNIDHVLTEQSQLKSRLRNEILDQITDIEHTKSDLEKLDKPLSPQGIPNKYNIAFLNEVIDICNALIKMVYSYPLSLKKIDVFDELDFKFPVKVGMNTVSSVSLCSDGQKAIIDLCFNLAIIKRLDLKFPIFLDEIGKGLDPYHEQAILHLLKYVIDHRLVPQMFLVNHQPAIYQGLISAQILVVNELNIVTPPVYNEHVSITKE